MSDTTKLTGSDLFVLGPDRTIKLEKTGEEIAIPKLSWGIEARALALVGKTLREMPEIAALFSPGNSLKGKDFLYLVIPRILEIAPDHVTELIAIILNKKRATSTGENIYDVDWVKDTLVLEDVVRILVPFMREYTGKLVKLTALVEASLPQSPT